MPGHRGSQTVAEVRSLLLAGNAGPRRSPGRDPAGGKRLGVSRPTMREALRTLQSARPRSRRRPWRSTCRRSKEDASAGGAPRAGRPGGDARRTGGAARVGTGEIAPAQLRYLGERRRAATTAARGRVSRRLRAPGGPGAAPGDRHDLRTSPVGAEAARAVCGIRMMIATGRTRVARRRGADATPDRAGRRASRDRQPRSRRDGRGGRGRRRPTTCWPRSRRWGL